jgi:hypothetical protein
MVYARPEQVFEELATVFLVGKQRKKLQHAARLRAQRGQFDRSSVDLQAVSAQA